jgi:selenocysteine lyase/cysteine desulfurase
MPESTSSVFSALEQGVYAALETYSNVHRGIGHNSMVTTYLFEQARDIILEYTDLSKRGNAVIFCTPRRATVLQAQLEPGSYRIVSSQDVGLPLAVRALVVKRKALPNGVPFQTGGGTTRLISSGWVIWADAPARFEAGTPAIINIIAFARVLKLISNYGKDLFRETMAEKLTAPDILYHDELEDYTGQKLLDELRKTLIGRDIIVPTAGGPKSFINLDNGASTPTFRPVWKAVLEAWRQPVDVQHEIIRDVRSVCARFLGAPLADYEVIFTSNTTEAINLVAESADRESGLDCESVVVNTLLEHTSNELPWRLASHLSLVRLPVNEEGFIDLKELEMLLDDYNRKGQYGKKRIRFVAVSGASNVLGVFNNLEEISRIVHRYGAQLIVDAAQMVAHRRVEMDRCGIDYLAFSAHKVYAPFGTGVLVARKGLLQFSTAELELIRSSGEENAGGVAALGKALILLERIGMDLIREEEQALTGKTLRGLAQIKGLRIYGIRNPDSPGFAHKGGVIVFALKGVFANQLARLLAERGGIGVRCGCHCAHLLVKYILHVPPVLEQFQRLLLKLFGGITLPGVTRVSLGIENTEKEIDILLRTLACIAGKDQHHVSENAEPGNNKTCLLSGKELDQQMKDFTASVVRRVYA